MERASRMVSREVINREQETICQKAWLRLDNKGYDRQKKILSRMERVMGESGYYETSHETISKIRVVLVVGFTHVHYGTTFTVGGKVFE